MKPDTRNSLNSLSTSLCWLCVSRLIFCIEGTYHEPLCLPAYCTIFKLPNYISQRSQKLEDACFLHFSGTWNIWVNSCVRYQTSWLPSCGQTGNLDLDFYPFLLKGPFCRSWVQILREVLWFIHESAQETSLSYYIWQGSQNAEIYWVKFEKSFATIKISWGWKV